MEDVDNEKNAECC